MSQFRVDILDSSGNRLGDGPLDNVLQLDDTVRLDAVGGLQFTTPAEDPRCQYIAAGAQFDVYDLQDGYLGRYYYESKSLDTTQESSTLTVKAHDQLIELARVSVHFRRVYSDVAVETVIADLVGEASGWSDTTDTGIGDTSVTYEGESVLRAVDVLRDRWNQHFRLGSSRVLEFGSFGSDSGMVLTNLQGQVQAEIDRNPYISIVGNLKLVEEADEIYNKFIPLGAGQGTTQLTIEQASQGTYTVLEGTNADASSYWYFEDTASIALYGQRETVLSFPQIRPITNSDANILNAANALKLTAEAYAARHLVPKVTYSVSVRGLRQEISVGDTVRLQYRGVVDYYSFVDVDADFYVLEVSRSRSSDGNRQADLTISTIAERRTSDTDIMLNVLSDLRALKVNVPVTLSKDRVGPYVLRCDSTNPAEFTCFIGDETLLLNYAKLRFKTSPLKSSVASVANGGSSSPTSSSGGGQTPTSSSGGGATVTSASGGATTSSADTGHTHTVTIGTHTHSVTTNNHTHAITIQYQASPSGVPVYYNSTSHFLNGTIGLGADDTQTSSSGGGETVSSASGGSSTPTSSGGSSHSHTIGNHTHDVTISSHTHTVTVSDHTHTVTIAAHNHTLSYGIYADTTYPQSITLEIDGELFEGGTTWALTNASVEVEIDITDYLVNAIGGLRQNHRLIFSIGSGQGEIEADINMLATIQAIAVS